jgi:two-component system, cell cycle sensor histidine kinase and response regulator CckA
LFHSAGFLTIHQYNARVSQPAPVTATRPARILVAEDEELILAVFQAILKKAGFEVIAASNGIQAASIFDAEANTFDLVITDLSLPGLDGTGLAAHIRKARPDMRIIFSTGNITHAPQQAAEQFKATFLPKPFGFEELVTTVNKALQG